MPADGEIGKTDEDYELEANLALEEYECTKEFQRSSRPTRHFDDGVPFHDRIPKRVGGSEDLTDYRRER